jgi:hypothetical protein
MSTTLIQTISDRTSRNQQRGDLMTGPAPHESDFLVEKRRSISGSSAQAKLAQLRAQGEMGWLVAVAVAFIIIHIAAGTIWLRASADGATTSRRDAVSSLYD